MRISGIDDMLAEMDEHTTKRCKEQTKLQDENAKYAIALDNASPYEITDDKRWNNTSNRFAARLTSYAIGTSALVPPNHRLNSQIQWFSAATDGAAGLTRYLIMLRTL